MKPRLDIKSTLNLPRTDFPMKARLAETEPQRLARWQQEQLYQRLRQTRQGAPVFVLHDGPPYANGEVHPGTALNKILKDFVVRSKSLAGFNAAFVPGWDCHGLPIEINVDKELGERKAQLSPLEIRQACRAYAQRFVDLHRETFMRLGCLGDWQKPYLTMSPEYEFVIADAFLTFLEKGYAYKGLKPVLWCWRDQTALAEAEIEYEMRTSPSVWVRFPVRAGSGPAGFPPGALALAWTTTPWSLPGTLALAFHPQLRYTVVERDNGEHYLLAEDLVERVAKDTGYRFVGQKGAWNGEELRPLQFDHPFLERVMPAVLADYVTLEQGTGVVTTAPGHGSEDFETGRKYDLEIYCPVDAAGKFTEGLEAYRGQQVFDANPRLIELLQARGHLAAQRPIEHSYPHCWRCHNPLIFRATEQWFISMEHKQLRQQALEAVKKVEWFPGWGAERMSGMIETRPDWCISRQRVWGVPIPVFYCDHCGEKLLDVPLLRTAIQWFKREGADAWYRYAPEDLLPQGTRCRNCGQTRFRRETDILDVWFDAGSSHLAVLGHAPELPWPADVYLEGNDQYRGWFNSSLLVALGVKGAPPYRAVVTHGWLLDTEGRPMSKSLGNYIPVRETCDKYGAEVLRLVTASVDREADIRFGPQLLEQTAEAYRKIRNTFRFCLSNLYDFDPARDALPAERLQEFDRWMLGRTAEFVREVREAYDRYEFHKIYHGLYNFCVIDLSAVYFDILKDRLYTAGARSPERRSAQTALYRIAHALARLVAPLLCYTSDEVWEHLPGARETAGSVHLAEFPRPEELDTGLSAEKAAAWETLAAVRREVLKALEQVRQAKKIRSSLEAGVYLRLTNNLAPLLEAYRRELRALFIVSSVGLGSEPRPGSYAAELPGLEISVEPAEGKKCERCWNYSVQVGSFPSFPTICERCAAVLETLGAEAGSPA
ncbi:MAG: isoleucine--tRNA ligase [Candidatus Acidiferrales bacterium]